MAYEHCIEQIGKDSGGLISKEDAEELLLAMGDRISRNIEKGGFTPEQALAKEAKRLGRDLQDFIQVKKAQAFRNEVKKHERNGFFKRAVSAGGNEVDALNALLVGQNKEFFGSRLSVENIARYKEVEYAVGFVQELRREGLEKLFVGKQYELEVLEEVFELDNRSTGVPGKTGNPDALKVAQIIHKYQTKMMSDLNAEGAYVRSMMGHIAHQLHDADKIRGGGWRPLFTRSAAGREKLRNQNQTAWVNHMLANLDLEKTFRFTTEEAKIRAILEKDWGNFAAGNHLSKLSADEMQGIASGRGNNLAKTAAASRQYHFKGAKEFMEYQHKYGAGDVRSTIARSFQKNARQIGLMRVFGTNPQAAFDADIARIRGDMAQRDPFTLNAKTGAIMVAETRMRMLTGEAGRVVNKTADLAVRTITALQGVAKLGFAPFTSISDVATGANAIGRQTNQAKALGHYVNGMAAYFRGRGFEGTARRLEWDSLKIGMGTAINQISSRTELLDPDTRGLLSKIQNAYHRMTGLAYLTDTARGEVQVTLAHHYGRMMDIEWGSLHANERATMQIYGIGPAEWNVLRTSDALDFEGNGKLFEPGLALRATDEKISTLLGDLVASKENIASVREDLATRVGVWLHDSGTDGVLETSTRVRSLLGGGLAPGSFAGSVARLMAQFKAFPMQLMTRLWGQALFSGRGFGSTAASSMHLLVGMTVMGFGANVLRDLVQGREPRPLNTKTFIAAFTRGGGMGIIGDLMFSEAEKYGKDWYDPLIGPGAEFALDLGSIPAALARGDVDKAGEKAQQVVSKNLPGANIWYAKLAIDYLFLRAWQEALNPGVLARRQARDSREGVEYFIPPTARLQQEF